MRKYHEPSSNRWQEELLDYNRELQEELFADCQNGYDSIFQETDEPIITEEDKAVLHRRLKKAEEDVIEAARPLRILVNLVLTNQHTHTWDDEVRAYFRLKTAFKQIIGIGGGWSSHYCARARDLLRWHQMHPSTLHEISPIYNINSCKYYYTRSPQYAAYYTKCPEAVQLIEPLFDAVLLYIVYLDYVRQMNRDQRGRSANYTPEQKAKRAAEQRARRATLSPEQRAERAARVRIMRAERAARVRTLDV